MTDIEDLHYSWNAYFDSCLYSSLFPWISFEMNKFISKNKDLPVNMVCVD